MKITGYRLREAIKQWQLKKDSLEGVLTNSLTIFPGETKPHPRDVIGQLVDAENAIARLQEAQARYNLGVHVDGPRGRMSLSLAIKFLGGLARAEKSWRKASGKQEDRYGFGRDTERDPTKLYAKQQVTPEEAVEEALKAAKLTSELRAAIAAGNATAYVVEDLEESIVL